MSYPEYEVASRYDKQFPYGVRNSKRVSFGYFATRKEADAECSRLNSASRQMARDTVKKYYEAKGIGKVEAYTDAEMEEGTKGKDVDLAEWLLGSQVT